MCVCVHACVCMYVCVCIVINIDSIALGNQKPDLIQSVMPFYAAQWEELALKLGMTFEEVAYISQTIFDCEDCIVEVLNRCPTVTWDKLEAAIRKINDQALQSGNGR